MDIFPTKGPRPLTKGAMNVTILVRLHEDHNHAFSLSFTDVEEEKNIF